MHVHPDIAALRGDRAPQRHAQGAMEAACEAWRSEAEAKELKDDLHKFGEGAALKECACLSRVFSNWDEAARLMSELSRHFCAAIAENPIGHPPFRNGFDGRATSMLLARSGRAQMMVQSIEPNEMGYDSCSFSSVKRWDVILGGIGEARIIKRGPLDDKRKASLHENIVKLGAGDCLDLDLKKECLQVEKVESRLVILRLAQEDENPQPVREFDRKTGGFIQQSAGLMASSRQEAIINLLGRMGRDDAAPSLSKLAIEEGDTSLRWQAMRECLTLDSGEGFAALSLIAAKPHDPLAKQAEALRAQLLETYPQLHQLEAA